MPQKRPVAVVVIAALQLVFGVPALASYAFSLAGLDRAMASLGQVNPQGQQRLTLLDVEQRLEEKVPSYGPVQRAINGSGLGLAVLMIASGIGLLMFRPWGRLTAIAYAVLSILITAAFVVWYLAAVVPAVVAFGREIAATGGREAEAMELTIQAAYIGGPLVASLSAAYPVVVLLVLLRPSVRAAFRGEPVPDGTEEPDDYRDPAPPGGLDEPDDRLGAEEG